MTTLGSGDDLDRRIAAPGRADGDLPVRSGPRATTYVDTLVLLHPLPLDGSVWSDETRALAEHVVAPTLYGLGGSIESWASGVLDLAGPGPLVVVGNSVGGSCAIEVACRAPDRVRLLVLIGAKAGHRPEPGLRDAAVRALREDGMGGAWPRYWAPLFAPDADPDVVERARELACAQPVEEVVRGVRVFHSRPDRADALARLDMPVLVVSGEHDPVGHHGVDLAARAPRGALTVVPGAGHFVSLERPRELAAILRNVLAGHTTDP